VSISANSTLSKRLEENAMEREAKFDCIIVGVGGQGSIFAAGVLGETALREGYEVISAETHGMAQRGDRRGSCPNRLIVRTADSTTKRRRPSWNGARRVPSLRTLSFA
jgi:choline dehydrogenase-like flavoprotein